MLQDVGKLCDDDLRRSTKGLGRDVLTDDELKAVGRIAIRHTLVSRIVEYMLWALIDSRDDNIGANLTKRWPLSQIAEKLEALVPLRLQPGSYREAVVAWIAKAKWANRERNSIVHSALTRLHPDDDRLMHFQIVPGEGEAMVVVESFNAASLDYLAETLENIAEEGGELFDKLERELT